MSNKIYDVAGIGSLLLDFTIEVNESILNDLGLKKGEMHLVDESKSAYIFKMLKGYKIVSSPGGSAGNTLAGLALLGGKGVLFGTVGNDSNAEYYIDETEKSGIKPRFGRHDRMTGHAITFITPDSERTFATHLGAALFFRKQDVIADEIKQSNILHIEAYILELPELREAVIHAMDIAKENDVKISIDLADPALIGRIPDIILKAVRDYSDIVFVNELEAKAFTGKEEEDALNDICSMCDTAVVKLGSMGSLIKKNGAIHRIPAYKTNVVNTNGAGDMYAGGLLYGISRGLPLERAGRIASFASSLVVSQVSTRLADKIDIESIV